MREIVSIHVGQAGIQLGNVCWKLFCLEHGVQLNGQYNFEKTIREGNNAMERFFWEKSNCILVPRSIYYDLDSTTIDEVKIGSCQHLFKSEQLISGQENASNNFARGYYTIGNKNVDICLYRIRKQIENCDDLQGFLMFHSIGGGTGSGSGSLLLERLTVDYEKIQKLGFTVYPSPQLSNAVVEPYNSILSTHSLINHTDVCLVLDNNAIYDICNQKVDIERPSYTNLNRIIGYLISSLTLPLRVDESFHGEISEFQRYLVPFQRLHFMLCSYSPIINSSKVYLQQLSTQQITDSAFEPCNMMAKCNPSHGKFLGIQLLYRGDIVPKDIGNAIRSAKSKPTVQFFDWIPTGMKININSQPPPVFPEDDLAKVPKAVAMISNSSAIAEVFSNLNHKFDLMFAKRAFVHWYTGEGMEEGEFQEAREDLANLENDYETLEFQGNEDQT